MTSPAIDIRRPFRGAIHLLVPLGPWRIRFPLEGLALGPGGVSGLLRDRGDSGDLRDLGMTARGVTDLLAEGTFCEIQLEAESGASEGPLPPPPVPARILKQATSASGLELTLEFESVDALLLSLIEEHLAKRS